MNHIGRIGAGIGGALVALACSAPDASATWGTDPVTVTSTTATIPLVKACSDGAHGTFVAWQEADVLRAHHVLPTGDLDPAWPVGGAVACGVLVARRELVALPDRLGGLYLLWQEGSTLFATRLASNGAVAGGWPARGRALDVVQTRFGWPKVIEDGANGFYAAWVSWTGSRYVALAVRLGPANTGAEGWPNGPRMISSYDPEHWFTIWPNLALAPDGGLFVAWASFGFTTSGFVPGRWKLSRLTAAGLPASGWPEDGIDFGDFHMEYVEDLSLLDTSMLALAVDGRGGVFLMIGNPNGRTYGPTLETRLYRLRGDGGSALDWPEGGVVIANAPETYEGYWGHDGSHRLIYDNQDGVFVGMLALATDYGTRFVFQRCSADVRCRSAAEAWPPNGHEVASRVDGGLFIAAFHCCGPLNPFDLGAFIEASQYPRAVWSFRELHPESCVQWYGDVGLASTEDGGAVFFWSQVRERVGLFARRFTPTGEVTWSKRASRPAPRMTSIRFFAGEGVRVAMSSKLPGAARFELFDASGRRVASQAIDARGDEVTIAGTAGIPAGLYFGRLRAGPFMESARFIVAR